MIRGRDSKRLLSIDVFRGITLFGMLLVNNQGSLDIYPFLEHARWNEWSFADLVFPFFLFIVGVVMPFSFSNRLSHDNSRNRLYLQLVKRTVILFGLGLFINSFPYLGLSRIPGVLQRIALCYFFSSLVVLKTSVRGQGVVAIILLAIYWVLMKAMPVPDVSSVLTAEMNLGAYIDRFIFRDHMMEPTWDPEGLLSTVPAISTTLFGVLAGHLLRSSKSPTQKTTMLLISGAGGIVVGKIMDIWFPINKILWSPAYTVFTAGIASICLGLCYWLVEVKGYRRWSVPFVIYGVNAIAVYAFSSVLANALYRLSFTASDGSKIRLRSYIFDNFYASWAGPGHASFFYALTHALIWLGFAAVLFRKKIFIKI
ncbi:MAG: DUF5009 domain-containing protein [Candidatus Omnitrophica bacterium]|nr:DUF5009 domain-containing protein [Candidatus Omnitrophota bacterium]